MAKRIPTSIQNSNSKSSETTSESGGKKGNKQSVEVTIGTPSWRFLQQFCPESIASCLEKVHHTPRSKFVTLTLNKSKCSCISKLSDDLGLLDSVSHEIAKDISKIKNKREKK